MLSLALVIALFGCALAELPEDKCGRPAITPIEGNTLKEGRIVGGKEARPHSWPWQLYALGSDGYSCGGSLISNSIVLTAAHCVSRLPAGQYTFRAGLHSRTSSNQPYEQRSVGAQKIIHELYNSGRFKTEYDVALVRLRSPFTYTDQVSAVCLPKQNTELAPGELVHITGFGITEGTCCPNVVKQVQVPILAREQCNQTNYYNGNVTSSMICAGLEQGGLDSCGGDSGGPLVIKKNGRYEEFGIVSWGWGCADPYNPGLYANVIFLKDWILRNVERLEGEEELVARKFKPVPFGSAFR